MPELGLTQISSSAYKNAIRDVSEETNFVEVKVKREPVRSPHKGT